MELSREIIASKLSMQLVEKILLIFQPSKEIKIPWQGAILYQGQVNLSLPIAVACGVYDLNNVSRLSKQNLVHVTLRSSSKYFGKSIPKNENLYKEAIGKMFSLTREALSVYGIIKDNDDPFWSFLLDKNLELSSKPDGVEILCNYLRTLHN